MTPGYQKLRFSEIKHKLPKDCWAYWRNEKNNGELDNEIVLYVNGDLQTDHLDLNNAFGFETLTESNGEREFPMMLLVEGNLTVHNYIYNENTDGTTGLMILGNLSASNIIAGGQEIFVTGNLDVKELFWGDYNHGDLKVSGNISVGIFISTDYSFDHKRFSKNDRVQYQHWLWSEDDGITESNLTELLEEECLILDEEEEPIIWREKMLEFLQAGKPVIKPFRKLEIPFVFENRIFDVPNLRRLRESPLFLATLPAGASPSQKVEYWNGEDFKRVQVIKEINNSESVYFQRGIKALLVAYVELQPGQYKEGEPSEVLTVRVRDIEGEDTDWYYYNPALPAQQPFMQMGEAMWDTMLDEWSEMEYWHQQFTQAVTVEKIQNILGNATIKSKYSKYYDEAAEGIWNGMQYYSFRQANKEKNVDARITIARQLDSGDEPVFEFFHFDIKELQDGTSIPLFCTQDGNGFEFSTYEVSKADVSKIKKAVYNFTALENYISKHY